MIFGHITEGEGDPLECGSDAWLGNTDGHGNGVLVLLDQPISILFSYYSMTTTLRLVKILDAGFVSSIYLFISVTVANKLNYYFEGLNEKKEHKKTFLRRTLELLGITWLLVAIIYIIQYLVEFIPSPFHALTGFDYYRPKDIQYTGIFIFILLFLQTHYRERLIAYENDI